jgi:hypothetical protein
MKTVTIHVHDGAMDILEKMVEEKVIYDDVNDLLVHAVTNLLEGYNRNNVSQLD